MKLTSKDIIALSLVAAITIVTVTALVTGHDGAIYMTATASLFTATGYVYAKKKV